MKVLVQRVMEASVYIDKTCISTIQEGYLLYVGFTHTDTLANIEKMIDKILKLRIYEDEAGKTNVAIPSHHDILSVSQFTLYASTKGQHRPGFSEAMKPSDAHMLYQRFNDMLSQHITVKTGQFGADMSIHSINNGPMTILLEV